MPGTGGTGAGGKVSGAEEGLSFPGVSAAAGGAMPGTGGTGAGGKVSGAEEGLSFPGVGAVAAGAMPVPAAFAVRPMPGMAGRPAGAARTGGGTAGGTRGEPMESAMACMSRSTSTVLLSGGAISAMASPWRLKDWAFRGDMRRTRSPFLSEAKSAYGVTTDIRSCGAVTLRTAIARMLGL